MFSGLTLLQLFMYLPIYHHRQKIGCPSDNTFPRLADHSCPSWNGTVWCAWLIKAWPVFTCLRFVVMTWVENQCAWPNAMTGYRDACERHVLACADRCASIRERNVLLRLRKIQQYSKIKHAPLRHNRNSPSHFSFFTALFCWVANQNLQHGHCSSICNALMVITGVMETLAICRLYCFHWPWFLLQVL